MSDNNYILFFCEDSQQDGFPAIGQEEPLKFVFFWNTNVFRWSKTA